MADKHYSFGEKTAKKLHEFSKSTWPFYQDDPAVRGTFNSFPIIFRNDYTETVPPYGCVQVTGAELSPITDNYIVLVDRPDGTQGSHYLINGPAEVEAGDYGQGFASGVLRVLVDSSTVELNAMWGPKEDSFMVSDEPTDPLIVVFGQIEESPNPNLIYGLYSTDARSRLFKAPIGGLPARNGLNPGTAECTLLRRETTMNELIETTTMFDVYNWATVIVCAEGERLGVADLDGFGTWWVEAEECFL